MSLTTPTFANQRHNPLYIKVINLQHFYTSGDHVEGIVRVEPTTRPVHISILFKGVSISHNTNGGNPEFFQYSLDLFVSTGAGENFDILRRGTADDGKVELPFGFTFPHIVRLPPPSDRTWWYSKDLYNHPRFQHSPGFPLPPSCAPLPSATGPLTPKIVYYLEAHMESVMPDSPRTRVRQELKFIPPAPDYHPALLQPDLNFGPKLPKHCCRYKFIRTRKLMPGYGESSKLGKLKDVLVDKELFFGIHTFSEIPFARFNLFATPARILIIGSRIPVTVTVQHLDRSSSLPYPPDLFLRRLRVQVFSTFYTFTPSAAATRHGAKEAVDITRDTVTLSDTKFDSTDGQSLCNGLNLLDVANVRLAHDNILPSFTSYGLALEHELQVEIWGECAGREFSGIMCREQIQIVADWHASLMSGIADEHAGPPDADSRPAYQELDPMASLSGGAVQDLVPSTLVYEPESVPRVQPLNSRVVPPPPYVG